jgi:hypothetical protein
MSRDLASHLEAAATHAEAVSAGTRREVSMWITPAGVVIDVIDRRGGNNVQVLVPWLEISDAKFNVVRHAIDVLMDEFPKVN